MGYNKFVYHGETKFDLSADTVTADKLAYGVTAHNNAGDPITGTSTKDSDTSDATVLVAEMLDKKTAYARGAKLVGTMPNNGSVTGSISTKTGQYTVPSGYHDGSGKVGIAASAVAGLTSNNIRNGITILGVTGDMAEDTENPEIGKTVTPSNADQTITPSGDCTCFRQIVVKAIPYAESPNAAGGTTITIG